MSIRRLTLSLILLLGTMIAEAEESETPSSPPLPEVTENQESSVQLKTPEEAAGPEMPGKLPDDTEIGPAYFLYSVGTGEYGPCVNRIGTYLGEWSLYWIHYETNLGYVYSYDRQFHGIEWVGDHRHWVYEELGFNSAHVYQGCYQSYPAYGYFGANKVSRRYELVQYCPPEFMTCTPGFWRYDSWREGW